MPFKSLAQSRLCYALKRKGQAKEWDCDEFSRQTDYSKLPNYVNKKKSNSRKYYSRKPNSYRINSGKIRSRRPNSRRPNSRRPNSRRPNSRRKNK